MVERKPDVMVDTGEEVGLAAETVAAIDRGLRAADEGRSVDFQVLYTEPELAAILFT